MSKSQGASKMLTDGSPLSKNVSPEDGSPKAYPESPKAQLRHSGRLQKDVKKFVGRGRSMVDEISQTIFENEMSRKSIAPKKEAKKDEGRVSQKKKYLTSKILQYTEEDDEIDQSPEKLAEQSKYNTSSSNENPPNLIP